MSDLIWRIREFIRKMIPLVVVAVIAWGGYQLYRQGAFRHGLKPALYRVMSQVPIIGSRFRSRSSSRRSQWVASRPHKRYGRVSKRSHRRRRR